MPAYLLGALRDGTFNRLHRTTRISQADERWLRILQVLLQKLGKCGWIYREGSRGVWTISRRRGDRMARLSLSTRGSALSSSRKTSTVLARVREAVPSVPASLRQVEFP